VRPFGVHRLGPADTVTLGNVAIGFAAAAVARSSPGLAARLLLLAAIADGLDGVVARLVGGSAVGETLDAVADAVSFGVAPGLLLLAVGSSIPFEFGTPVAAALGALFAVASVLRTGLYAGVEARGLAFGPRPGVPNTLVATVFAAAVLAGVPTTALLAATPPLAYAMLADIGYPDLRHRDALLMGGVQALAIAAPAAGPRLFPRVLLVAAVAFLALGPRHYPGRTDG
jgi:CDP-diacylglycerol--serine O-phosphatidyltransferase